MQGLGYKLRPPQKKYIYKNNFVKSISISISNTKLTIFPNMHENVKNTCNKILECIISLMSYDWVLIQESTINFQKCSILLAPLQSFMK